MSVDGCDLTFGYTTMTVSTRVLEFSDMSYDARRHVEEKISQQPISSSHTLRRYENMRIVEEGQMPGKRVIEILKANKRKTSHRSKETRKLLEFPLLK
jgi:hypothetical protein